MVFENIIAQQMHFEAHAQMFKTIKLVHAIPLKMF